MLLPQHPYFANQLQMVMRSAVSPDSLIDPVRSKMRALNPEVATKFTTMEAMVSDSIATPRLRVMLAGLFAGVALLLAVVRRDELRDHAAHFRIRRAHGTWGFAESRTGVGAGAGCAHDLCGRGGRIGPRVFNGAVDKHHAVRLESQ
jgi:hypothetical protein